MDYAEAAGIIKAHSEAVRRSRGAVAQRATDRKKLKNATWLTGPEEDPAGTGNVFYRLELFEKTIIHFFPDCLVLRDHGYFGRTTHDRFNEYLPRGFRVWGETVKSLKLERPLGFIKTPAGVYPYSMPSIFYYDGVPAAEMRTHQASEAAHALSAYANKYLQKLFHEPQTMSVLPELRDSDVQQGIADSRQAAHSILNSVFPVSFAIGMALANRNVEIEGLPFATVIAVLAKYGARPFQNLGTARSMEVLVEAGARYQKIGIPTLSKTLRPLLIQHLVKQLGFDEVEWHRMYY